MTEAKEALASGLSEPLNWTTDWRMAEPDGNRCGRKIGFGQPVQTSSVTDEVTSPPMIQGMPLTMCLDASGNRYVAGSFEGTRDFNPARGVDARKSIGKRDGFITRFNADGTYAWTASFGRNVKVEVTGVALVNDTVFAAGGESNGHVFIAAVDRETGKPCNGFAEGGIQTFMCGRYDRAIAIAGDSDTLYVAVCCQNILARKGRGSELFGVVLALDARTGKPIASFGDRGVQTVGNARPRTQPLVEELPESYACNAIPHDLVVAGAAIYLVGSFDGVMFGIARKGRVQSRGQAGFITAIDAKTGLPNDAFGVHGVQTLTGCDAAGAAVYSNILYITGRCGYSKLPIAVGKVITRVSPPGDDTVFTAALSSSTGAPRGEFGQDGFQLLSRWHMSYSNRIQVTEEAIYIVGGYTQERMELGKNAKGIFIASYDRGTGTTSKGFGDRGIVAIEGPAFEQQGAIQSTKAAILVVARSGWLPEEKGFVKVGDWGEINATGWPGFLFNLDRSGKMLNSW